MPLRDFHHVFMPYCLQKLKDGRYLVLNRYYKPVGFYTEERLNYEDYPIAVHLKAIDSAMATKLSCDGSDDADHIFLYDINCDPTDKASFMNAYLVKLRILARLEIK